MEIVSDGLLMKLPSCASFTLRRASLSGIFSALYLLDHIPIFLALGLHVLKNTLQPLY